MQGRTLFEAKGIPGKLQDLERRTQEPDFWTHHKAANALFEELRNLRNLWDPLTHLLRATEELLERAKKALPADVPSIETDGEKLQNEWRSLETQLYFSGTFDTGNCYVSISAGAGGTEAQDWAAMLLRMILRYCEQKQWITTLLEKTSGQEAGIKAATVRIDGEYAYGHLKCERGVHRLVRLSPFNAKNLRQTSFALIEVLPCLPETEVIAIPPQELRIDTFRSGGAGGQHVNKTESAVRITHLPTNLVVHCQSERSQQQNRAQAMGILQARLLERRRQEEQKKKTELKGATASADFGQQIRSYVLHPYKLVKDLRTNVETSNPTDVLDGNLQPFIDAELKRLAGKTPSPFEGRG